MDKLNQYGNKVSRLVATITLAVLVELLFAWAFKSIGNAQLDKTVAITLMMLILLGAAVVGIFAFIQCVRAYSDEPTESKEQSQPTQATETKTETRKPNQ